MTRCRSCKAPILWARTERGKNMPLDAEPYVGPEPGGLFVLREPDEPKPLAVAVPPGAFPDEPHYRSHFATCPHAADHRRSR